MKQRWINWRRLLIDDNRLSFGEKAMGLYLNTFMNDRHDFAFPSIATICGELALGSNKTAIKYLAGLELKGYLIKEKRYGKSVIYHSTIPENFISSVTPTLLEEVHPSSVRGTPTVVYEVHTNKQKNKQKNKQVANDSFDRFWKAYPKKVGKKEARTAFTRLSKTNQEKAIADSSCRFNGNDPQYIPNPATYIRGERWTDEVSKAEAKPFSSSNLPFYS